MSGYSALLSVPGHLPKSKGSRRLPIQVFWTALSVALAVFASPSHGNGQGTDTALLRGTVSDRSGGVIPGASVTMTNDATQVSERALTDAAGRYIFNALKPASY